jgi:hypothetical protein
MRKSHAGSNESPRRRGRPGCRAPRSLRIFLAIDASLAISAAGLLVRPGVVMYAELAQGACVMKHKTWFRLVLKAIGVYLVVNGIPDLVLQAGSMLIQFSSLTGQTMPTGWTPMQQLPWMIVQGLHWMLQLGLGFYLLFGGEWIVNNVIPSNRPYCPECGYDLSKSRGVRCPECGVTLPRDAAPPSTPA